MRLIRLKLEQEVTDLLKIICKRCCISDIVLVQDLYSLIRLNGKGIPDATRVAKLAENYAKEARKPGNILRIILNTRANLLRTIKAGATFVNVLHRQNVSDVERTEIVITAHVILSRKLRQAQCLTCNLLSKCAFGQEYGKTLKDVRAVCDPTAASKVHEDCPIKPEIELASLMASAAEQFKKMPVAISNATSHAMRGQGQPISAQELAQLQQQVEEAQQQAEIDDLDGDILDGIIDDAEEDEFLQHTGTSSTEAGFYSNGQLGQNVVAPDAFVEALTKEQLLIYELSRKLEHALGKSRKGDFKPTEVFSKDKRQRNIRSTSEMTKVLTSQQALDDDVFTAKLIKKELTVKQNVKPESKVNLLYLLIDVSGSMLSGASLINPMRFLTRAALATAIGTATMNHVEAEGGYVFCRFFDGSTSRLFSCRKKEEFSDLRTYLARSSFSGWSTNVEGAIMTACADIHAAKDELNRAEILCITDDTVYYPKATVAKLRTELGATVLNMLSVEASLGLSTALFVPQTTQAGEYASVEECMKELTDSYYRVKPGAQISDFIAVVSCKKKAQSKT